MQEAPKYPFKRGDVVEFADLNGGFHPPGTYACLTFKRKYSVINAKRGGEIPGSQDADGRGISPFLIQVVADDNEIRWCLADNFVGVVS